MRPCLIIGPPCKVLFLLYNVRMSVDSFPSPAPGLLPCGRPYPAVETRLNCHGLSKDSQALLKQKWEQLRIYAQNAHLKQSKAREKILEIIIYEARHFTVPQLLKRMHKRYPNIGKATLYRTLPLLVSSGVLQEGPSDPDGQTLYELTADEHHDHIVCLDCRQIFEFHDAVIERRQNALLTRLHLRPKLHRHVIFAACEYRKRPSLDGA